MRPTRLALLMERQVAVLATTLCPSTIRGYHGSVRLFLSYLAREFPTVSKAGQLRRDPHILGWLTELWSQRPPLSVSTRTQRILHLRCVLEELAEDHPEVAFGLIRSSDLPRKDHYLPRPLSADDDERLQRELWRRAEVPVHEVPSQALLLMRWTGVRIGELVDLSEDCLRPLGGPEWALHVPVGKLHRERWVPVNEQVRQLVQRLRFLRTLPAPPSTAEAEPCSQQPFLLSRPHGRGALLQRLRTALREAAAAAGLVRVVPHQLRHTFATEMLRSGVSFPAVMKLLGHTSPEMTLRYVEVTQTDLQREYRSACARPRHLFPAIPVEQGIPPAPGLPGVLAALSHAQQRLEALRREHPVSVTQRTLGRLGNRLSKIAVHLRKLNSTD